MRKGSITNVQARMAAVMAIAHTTPAEMQRQLQEIARSYKPVAKATKATKPTGAAKLRRAAKKRNNIRKRS